MKAISHQLLTTLRTLLAGERTAAELRLHAGRPDAALDRDAATAGLLLLTLLPVGAAPLPVLVAVGQLARGIVDRAGSAGAAAVAERAEAATGGYLRSGRKTLLRPIAAA